MITEGFDVTAATKAALSAHPHIPISIADYGRIIEAALPVIRRQLVAQIEAERPESGSHVLMTERRQGLCDAFDTATRIVGADA